MNNSVYGKSMESTIQTASGYPIGKYWQKIQKHVAAPTYQAVKVFDENLVGL